MYTPLGFMCLDLALLSCTITCSELTAHSGIYFALCTAQSNSVFEFVPSVPYLSFKFPRLFCWGIFPFASKNKTHQKQLEKKAKLL